MWYGPPSWSWCLLDVFGYMFVYVVIMSLKAYNVKYSDNDEIHVDMHYEASIVCLALIMPK